MNVGLFGLGGNHSDAIIGSFNLKLFEGVIVIPPPTRGGSFTVPFNLADEDDYPTTKRIEVLIKVRFGSVWFERVFWMLPKEARQAIEVTNLVNRTRERASVVITSIQNVITTLSFRVSEWKINK